MNVSVNGTSFGKGMLWLTSWQVDPWFNFRATRYLVDNGFYEFWDWFDDSKMLQTTVHLLNIVLS